MKAIVDKICKELNKKAIDWEQLEEYISGLGTKINAYDEADDKSIMSEAYMSHRHPGSINVRLTKLFVKYGFDVKANEGRNGESCLCALCWSSHDHYVLHVAEMLFNMGASDRDGYVKDADKDNDEAGILNSIGWKFGYWHIGEYDVANMFVAYYILAERALAGKAYAGIRAFRDCVGKTVTKVERIKEKGARGDKVRTSYLLHCEEMYLVATDYVEFIINPYAREEAIEIEDASEEFKNLIGAKVVGLRYFNSSLAKLKFNNGFAMLIGEVESASTEKKSTWFRLTSSSRGKLPTVGTAIESIKLWGQIRHSETTTFYREHTIVLNTEEYSYVLYANGKGYDDASVRIEEMDKELVSGLERTIFVENLILKHVEYKGDAVKWISFSCDGGVIYVVSKGYDEIAMFMCEYEIEPDDVRYVGFSTKGLKKIKPLS